MTGPGLMLHHRHFAGGSWRDNRGTERQRLVDPARGTEYAELRFCSEADVHLAVAAARGALPGWSSSSLGDRRVVLQRLREAMQARREAFVQTFAQEVGCPVALGAFIQNAMPLNNMQFIEDGLDQVAWEEPVRHSLVRRLPVGVVAAITPWNAPLHQIVAKVAGVIAAGATVVLKPSELAPQSALLFAEAVEACGLPSGVFNLVWGGASVGEQLVMHPGIDMISFTGSDAVGRRIAVAAGGQLKRVALELGGKSAAVVLDDADFDVAVSAVFRQSMVNSGQACVCQSRLLVPRRRLREAEERLSACASAWSVGDPFDPNVQMGPLASSAQLERAQGFVARADAAGLRRLFGGQRPPGVDRGFYLSPTAYTEVPPQADLAQNEVFGPVLALIPYDDDDQAVAIANGTAFGLSGAVWSGDAQRAERFARRLRTGQVVLNGAPQNLAAPFGGFGHSGQGRENGRFSIEAFLELQALQRPLE